MDQVKTALAQLKKFHFWILCGVIAFMALGSWYMTQASLNKEFEANKTEIEGGYTTAQGLNQQTNPPNPNVHEGMQVRIRELQQLVAAAWKAQYDAQKDTILKWPSGPDELTPRFIRAVEPLRPIEEKFPEFPTPPEKEINADLRREYANYIKEELPKLAEVIGAIWKATAPAAGSGGYGGMSGYGGYEGGGYGTGDVSGSMPDTAYGGYGAGGYGSSGYGPGGQPMAKIPQPVVEWSSGNQSQLMTKFDWSQQMGGVPTTLQILYAQEDLWVLKNLMEVIRKTNDNATERHKAFIKQIESIQLGREAAGRTGQITRVSATPMGAMGMEGMGSMGSMGGSMDMSMGSEVASADSTMGSAMEGMGSMGSMMPGGMVGGMDPAQGRYVDKDYKPLDGAKLRSDVTTNADEVYLAVAKRMPVRLVCKIDQRKIHKLIAECGNSPLTIEVRQVRIGGNAGKGGMGGYGGYGSSGGYGTSDVSYSGMSDMGSSEGYSSMSGYGEGGYGGSYGSGGGMAAAQAANDVTVEIYGIVYIYNPVNKKALGIEETESAAGGAGALTADATAPKNPS
jgi:hypothetical protein